MELAVALELGADHYVRLPCGLTEIMLRIWALLRRVRLPSSPESKGPLSSGLLSINPSTCEVFLADQRVTLTPTECRLLHLLVRHRGIVVGNQTLAGGLSSGCADSPRLLKRHVQRLRRKLGDDAKEPSWIASIHGVGYRFIGPLGAQTSAPMPV